MMDYLYFSHRLFTDCRETSGNSPRPFIEWVVELPAMPVNVLVCSLARKTAAQPTSHGVPSVPSAVVFLRWADLVNAYLLNELQVLNVRDYYFATR